MNGVETLRSRLIRNCLAAVLALAFTAAHAQDSIKCPDTRDTWLSAANKQECDMCGGKAPRIKLKVWQEFGLLDFDVSALKGKRIEKAELHFATAGGAVHGGARGTDLRWFTVSTVSSQWEEGNSGSFAEDTAGHGATFNEASHKTRPWTLPGSKCWDVILGNGKTLRCDADGGDPKGGWFTIQLDKRLVQALVAKASYGLLLMDGSTGVYCNSYIESREGKNAPYLEVTVAGDEKQPPAVPGNVSVQPAPNDATQSEGAALISLTVPENAFAYDVKINGEAVPRWKIPFAEKSGSTQKFVIEYLPPDEVLKVEIAAIDGAGNASPVATASGKSSPKLTVPKLPASDWQPKGGTPPVAGDKLKVWAIPEISKIDPLSGKIKLEAGMDEAASKNSVWDAGAVTVRVAAARGEIAEFQLVLEAANGPVSGIKINIAGLDDIQTKQWRTWFVKPKDWEADYAVPIKDTIAIPAEDNKIPAQKAAAVAIDLIVPAASKAGERSGSITISGEGIAETKLTLKLHIFDTVIPQEVHFNPELNCYGGPGQAGTDFFFDSFKLAHYHRATINRVPYSQSGNVHGDYVPAVDATGKVTDWSNFDKNLGPLLDGSVFKDNPRSGVPVPTFYLPQNENWPVSMHANYHPDAPLEGKGWKDLHDIKAKPPEEAFTQSYKDGFAANVADFVKHFEEKGWNKTICECFFNNKFDFGKDKMGGTAWTMDEPFEYLDWHALLFYSRLFHKGIKDAKTTHFLFRGDISRPMWQGNCCDGLMEILYAGGGGFDMFPIMKDHKRRMPTIIYAYGAANGLDRPNFETTAWCLKAYLHECDGVLPWDSLGGDESFDKGNDNGLIVDGRKRFGLNAIASFRVHAMRSGAQLVELMRLIEQKKGWGRAQLGALVTQIVPMASEYKQAFQDDAAATKFKGLNGDQFVILKEGLLKLLAQ